MYNIITNLFSHKENNSSPPKSNQDCISYIHSNKERSNERPSTEILKRIESKNKNILKGELPDDQEIINEYELKYNKDKFKDLSNQYEIINTDKLKLLFLKNKISSLTSITSSSMYNTLEETQQIIEHIDNEYKKTELNNNAYVEVFQKNRKNEDHDVMDHLTCTDWEYEPLREELNSDIQRNKKTWNYIKKKILKNKDKIDHILNQNSALYDSKLSHKIDKFIKNNIRISELLFNFNKANSLLTL